jgi:hypothetical protein
LYTPSIKRKTPDRLCGNPFRERMLPGFLRFVPHKKTGWNLHNFLLMIQRWGHDSPATKHRKRYHFQRIRQHFRVNGSGNPQKTEIVRYWGACNEKWTTGTVSEIYQKTQ